MIWIETSVAWCTLLFFFRQRCFAIGCAINVAAYLFCLLWELDEDPSLEKVFALLMICGVSDGISVSMTSGKCNLSCFSNLALLLLLLLLLSASPYSGSPQRESIFHFSRSTSSPSLAPTLSMSSLAKSIHLLLGLPLFLLPGTAISIIVFPT